MDGCGRVLPGSDKVVHRLESCVQDLTFSSATLALDIDDSMI